MITKWSIYSRSSLNGCVPLRARNSHAPYPQVCIYSAYCYLCLFYPLSTSHPSALGLPPPTSGSPTPHLLISLHLSLSFLLLDLLLSHQSTLARACPSPLLPAFRLSTPVSISTPANFRSPASAFTSFFSLEACIFWISPLRRSPAFSSPSLEPEISEQISIR